MIADTHNQLIGAGELVEKHAVVIGNVAEGFTIYGVFDSFEEAGQYEEDVLGSTFSSFITTMYVPAINFKST